MSIFTVGHQGAYLFIEKDTILETDSSKPRLMAQSFISIQDKMINDWCCEENKLFQTPSKFPRTDCF